MIDDSKNRSKIGLQKRNKDFLKKLKIINIDLNKKRDPIAHRKSIYVPPTVIINDTQQFIPIIDSLKSDNEKIYKLCKDIVEISNNKSIIS